MITLIESPRFAKWLSKLKDTKAKSLIALRLRSASQGNFGDCKSVGESLFEMRVHYGPGYRIYYNQTGNKIYLLLGGGIKSSQARDIAQLKRFIKDLPEIDHDHEI